MSIGDNIMYDYDDFYNEPTEFEALIYELKESLMKEVKEEYQAEMERLRKENAELRDIKNNWEEKINKLEYAERRAEYAIQQAEENAKRARLSDLIAPIVKKAWGIHSDYEYIWPKCDKCDEKGYIHFTSPSGKDCTEQCSCRKMMRYCKPIEAKVAELDNRREDNGVRVFFEFEANNDSDYGLRHTTSVYEGEDFSEIGRYDDIVFSDEDECRKFCEYLNEQERKEKGL